MARFSKRSLEGEILIDHRASPGLTPEQMAGFDSPIVAGGDVYESALITCGHCRAAVILNPQRTRDRGYCQKCDRYLCDECEYRRVTTLECAEYERRLDRLQRAIEQQPNVALQILTEKGL